MWEGVSRRRGHKYTYGLMYGRLMYGRNQHNIVIILQLKIKELRKKKKRIRLMYGRNQHNIVIILQLKIKELRKKRKESNKK